MCPRTRSFFINLFVLLHVVGMISFFHSSQFSHIIRFQFNVTIFTAAATTQAVDMVALGQLEMIIVALVQSRRRRGNN